MWSRMRDPGRHALRIGVGSPRIVVLRHRLLDRFPIRCRLGLMLEKEGVLVSF